MNDLEKYFRNNTKRGIDKFIQYFEIYDTYFSKFRNTDVHVMEIGVQSGGSLQMWKDYFGEKSKIFGVDIDERTKYEEDQIEIFILNQGNIDDLNKLKNLCPRIDILIDDGSHQSIHQIDTFKELFPHITNNGIYICEDLHTAYWPHLGGGYKKETSFIEYIKKIIDDINAWKSNERSHNKELTISDITRSVNSIHFYQSAVVIEKKITSKIDREKTGTFYIK